MTIKRTLGIIVLASALALGGAGCKQENTGISQNYNFTPHNEIAKAAEEDNFSSYTSGKKYHRAIFNAAFEIYQNNLEMMQEKGIEYNSNVQDILKLRDNAEENNFPAYTSGKKYHRAIYQLEQKILEQQDLLK